MNLDSSSYVWLISMDDDVKIFGNSYVQVKNGLIKFSGLEFTGKIGTNDK